MRERSGHVDVLLHAAGLEISRNLPEKEPGEFDLVFDVKTTGWFNVWQAARTMDVGAVVAFSSVAGRFGNNGQTDYAAANDLLCKTVSNLRSSRPTTRAIALDWTAWGGIGMATRGSIPKIMEMAGVQVLPPEAGVAWIRRELVSSGFSGEVVVAGELGLMAGEQHESGGVAPGALTADGAHGPMVGDVTLSTNDGVVDRVTLDPAEQAFLGDHRIDGTPVLPGVMGMEAFAEVASLVAPPGFRVAAVEDVAFLAPVKFYRDEPRTLTVSAVTGPDPDGGDDLVARCTLSAERTLPGHDAPVRTTHFTGRVRLTAAPAQEQRSELDRSQHDPLMEAEQVYGFYFHGPAYQVVEAAWRDGHGIDGPPARVAAGRPLTRGRPAHPRTTARGAVLPDRRPLGGRPGRRAGAAAARRERACAARPGRGHGPARGPRGGPRRARRRPRRRRRGAGRGPPRRLHDRAPERVSRATCARSLHRTFGSGMQE